MRAGWRHLVAMPDYKAEQRLAEYTSKLSLTYLPSPEPAWVMKGVETRDGKKWYLGKNQYGKATGWARFRG